MTQFMDRVQMCQGATMRRQFMLKYFYSCYLLLTYYIMKITIIKSKNMKVILLK